MQVVPAKCIDADRFRIADPRRCGTIVRLDDAMAIVVVRETKQAPFTGTALAADLSGQRAVQEVDVQFGPTVDLKDAFGRSRRDGRDIESGETENVLDAVEASEDIREAEIPNQTLTTPPVCDHLAMNVDRLSRLHIGAGRAVRLVAGAIASLVLACVSPAGAQTAAGTPYTVGDLVVSGAIRTRTYSWNWFGDLPEGDYWHQGTQVRLGVSRSKPRYDWQLEFEAPFMVHLPTTAVRAAPQGQLGLGAAYFAANNGNENPAGLFLKQGFVRINGLGGIAGQSLKVGRL
jgi:hypothetical protein